MKILHLIPYMHPSAGGPPVVVDRWCVELQKLGVDVDVLTTDAYSQGSADDQWLNQYQQNYPITALSGAGPNGFGYSTQLRQQFLKLLPSVDLVHVHNLWGYTNQLAARYCPRYKVPFVVSSHGMLDPHSVGHKWIRKKVYGGLLEWPALRKASGVVFTHAEEERLARQTCSSLPQGIVVPLATEDPPSMNRAELAERFLARFPECRGKRIVMFLSRLHPKKGLDLLIPAMGRVARSNPDVVLAIVGPGDWDYTMELRALADDHEILDRMVFTGPLQGRDKWSALSAADLFVLPSYQENFSIALVEALRAGTPAIISNRINIWEDLVAADAAVCCDLTVESVADNILQVLASSARSRDMGRKGIEVAKSNYTWPKSAATLAECYETVISRSPVREALSAGGDTARNADVVGT